MKKYEIMYILKSSLDENGRKEVEEALNKILTDNGAKVNEVKEWGLRELAYEIKKETKGFYVILKVEAENKALSEFNRLVLINNNVLRHLVTVDEK